MILILTIHLIHNNLSFQYLNSTSLFQTPIQWFQLSVFLIHWIMFHPFNKAIFIFSIPRPSISCSNNQSFGTVFGSKILSLRYNQTNKYVLFNFLFDWLYILEHHNLFSIPNINIYLSNQRYHLLASSRVLIQTNNDDYSTSCIHLLIQQQLLFGLFITNKIHNTIF